MNLYFKFFALIIKRLFSNKKISITAPCRTPFRVSPFDLDLNFHMNNGRFFSVMDLGRFDLLMRTGHFYNLISKGYYPVVLSEAIIFKKSLHLLDKYEIQTQIDSMDKNFFYLTQKFIKGDQLIASANVRACFKKRGRKGIVPPEELFEIFNQEFPGAQLSNLAKTQILLDNELIPPPN